LDQKIQYLGTNQYRYEQGQTNQKLKEKIEELEFVKDFQQDIIADMGLITGVDMSNLPASRQESHCPLEPSGCMSSYL
jgi:metal-sulfur cluster biosynthetic enzyme